MIKLYDQNYNFLRTIETRKCTEYHGKSLKDGWYIEAEIESSLYDTIQKTDEEIAAEPAPGMLVRAQGKLGDTPYRIKEITVRDGKTTIRADHIVYDAAYWPLATAGDLAITNKNFTSFYLLARADAVAATGKTSQYILSNVPAGITGTASKTYTAGATLLDVFEDLEELFGIEWRPFGYSMRPIITADKAAQHDLVYGRDIRSMRVDYDGAEVASKLYPYTSDGLRLASPGYIGTGGTIERCMARQFEVPTEDSSGTAYTEAERRQILQQLAEAWAADHVYADEQITVQGVASGNWTAGDLIIIKHPIRTTILEVKSYTYDCQTGTTKSVNFGNIEHFSIKNTLQQATGEAKNAKEIASLDSRVTTLEQSGGGGGISLQDVIDAAGNGEIQPIVFGVTGSEQTLQNGSSDNGLMITGDGRIELSTTEESISAESGYRVTGQTHGRAHGAIEGSDTGVSSGQLTAQHWSGFSQVEEARVTARTYNDPTTDPAEAALEALDYNAATGASVIARADGTVEIIAPSGLKINGTPYTAAS